MKQDQALQQQSPTEGSIPQLQPGQLTTGQVLHDYALASICTQYAFVYTLSGQSQVLARYIQLPRVDLRPICDVQVCSCKVCSCIKHFETQCFLLAAAQINENGTSLAYASVQCDGL